jgi:hypothetical protein
MLEQTEDNAEQLRDRAIMLSLNNRLFEAINKLNRAIALNPCKPEYNLQRGILVKDCDFILLSFQYYTFI